MAERKGERRELWILFLPGLGMDRDMYLPLLREMLYAGLFFRPRFAVNTPMLHPGESLSSYTRRIFFDQQLGGTHYDLVVAQSMGGMIAQQALEEGLLQCDHMLLISTAFCGEDLTLLSRWFAVWAARTPRVLHRLLRDALGYLYPIFRFTNPWGPLMGPMWRRCHPGLLFYAPRMVQEWRRGLARDQAATLPPSTRCIHGTGDLILSFRRVRERREVDLVIAGGSHVVFSTHAHRIFRMMESLLQEERPAGRSGSAGRVSRQQKAGRKRETPGK